MYFSMAETEEGRTPPFRFPALDRWMARAI